MAAFGAVILLAGFVVGLSVFLGALAFIFRHERIPKVMKLWMGWCLLVIVFGAALMMIGGSRLR
jgi:hypothetical protein